MRKRSSFKVCYLLKRYPRLSQTFVLNEMLELHRQGLDITVVALKESGEEIAHESYRELKGSVCYLSLSPSSAPVVRSVADEPSLSTQADRIASIVTRLGVDHIHAHFATWAASAASLVSERTGLPFSFTAHARDIYHRSVDRKALGEMIRKARFVVTVSDFNRRYLEGLISPGEGRVVRLYNGVDLKRFRPTDRERDPDLIVGIGRLVKKKGFHILIDACRILKEKGRPFRCVLIGEGEERVDLEKRIEMYSLEKDLFLLGARTQNEVIEWVRRASVFALPCIVCEDGDRDGLPTVLPEAMAVGAPVISTPVSGIPEIVRDGETGRLVAENDPQALADAIEEILSSRELQTRLKDRALQRVRSDFSLSENVKRLKELFLMEGRGQ
jgi:glycosyltransferase involved in cell wall biosynthesis